ncbi:murein biosynthesis integral membrane protein MurJ [Dissulfurirhabdus thermomarina]|uniref:murein biosynthesis integral membrane protein MurJ n=2 Tax=Dissulfurirhabdus thermomarina TaxID=1765737 RepID=UPI0031B59E89
MNGRTGPAAGGPRRPAGGGETAGIARSAGSVGFAVLLSRVLGLVREQVLAGLFGAGTAMDAFVVAYRIPNLLRDLFAEGALSAAFVAVFTDYDQKRTREETWALVNNVMAVLAVLLGLVVLLGTVFSDEIVRLMATGFEGQAPGKLLLTRRLTVIMFPFLILVSLASVVMGVLNTKGRFFIPALASSCFNLTCILLGGGLALVLPRHGVPGIVGMAVGTLAGGLAQLLVQWPLLHRLGFRLRPRIDLRDPGLRRIGLLMVPAVVGLSATQINIFVNTRFASLCAPGSVAWLSYAFRIMFLPIGMFGVALSIATMPVVSRQAARREIGPMRETLVSSLTLGFALTVPAAVGLWILAEPVVRLLFEHGRFGPHDTLMTAAALRFFLIGLFAYGAVKIVVPVFYALDDAKWPVIGSFTAVGVNLAVVWWLLGPLQHRAVALALSVAMTANFLLLAVVLYRKVGGYPAGRLVASLAKICLASAVMGWVLVLLRGPLFLEPGAGFWATLWGVGAAVVLGAACYAVVLAPLRVPEVAVLASALRRRLGRTGTA